MRIAGWMTEAKNTHSQYVVLTAFRLQKWLHERTACYVTRTLPALSYNATTGVKIIYWCICNFYTTFIHILLKQDHNPVLHHILLLHMRRSLPVSSSSAGWSCAAMLKFKGAVEWNSKCFPILNQPELCLDSMFRRVCILTKCACYIRHVRLSVNLRVSAQLPLEGFSWNLIMGYLYVNISRNFKFC